MPSCGNELVSRPVHDVPNTSMFRELMWTNRTVLAASSAAVVGVLAGYPFDSVKTRLQTQSYGSISACVRQTYTEEGFRGFFRGILPPLVTVSIIKSISFSVYEETKAFCKKHYSFFEGDTIQSTMAVSTLGGTASGAFIATLSCPFELVKIQKQLEFLLQASSISTGATVVRSIDENDRSLTRPLRRTVNRTVGAGLPVAPTASPPVPLTDRPRATTSSWASAKEIVSKKGLTGLYSGFGLHFVRDAIGTGVYFGGYETTKFLLTSKDRASGPLTQFLAGGVCGILCWLVVFPIDLVKSIIQKETVLPNPTYKRTIDCVRDIYKNKGLAGFYRGVTVTLIRAFPIHSLNFLVYEQTLLFIRHTSHHDPVSL